MKCIYCGAVAPENANFCMGCGRPLSSATPQRTVAPMTPPTQNRSKAKWLGVGVGVLLLMALAFVVGTQSGLITQANVKKPEGPSILEAQPPKVEGPSVLEAQPPKIEGPSVVEAEAPKQPPKHVVDWLEHLRRTEERRQRMERNVAPVMSMLVQAMVARAAAMSGVAQGDFDKAEADYEREREKLRQGYQQRQREWAELMQYFKSVPPPTECQTLADAYFTGLSQYITSITQIEKSLIENDLSGLTSMLGSAQSDLDARFARADEELTRVCEQYGIRKYFAIGARGTELIRSLGGGLPLGF
ncbi:MAG: zinc ribbon domain-containing protein [Fimbriimonadales bacterium]|nr:zinc ribbon domain-containing protein [Fimbriimonadales bacterium]